MSNNKKSAGGENFFSKLVKHQIFIPLMAFLILILFNMGADIYIIMIQGKDVVSFFNIDYNNGILSGNLISVLDYGSELAILAIGMTLVTAASGGQDISVGSAVAIGGSVILKVLRGNEVSIANFRVPVIVAFFIACVVAMLFGAFNGILVAYFKIQPMVATLILFTAGRSIAGWINNNENLNVTKESFKYFGGFIPGIPIPTPFIIAVVCMVVIGLVLKFTTLGLYAQSVGINASSSRLNGINPAFIKFLTFVILGICVSVVSLIMVSRNTGINYSKIALNIEMDAILAVALGGNPLGGGKFNMAASIMGAYVIQFLTTTLLRLKVPSVALPAYKAVVVIILVVISAPTVKNKISAFFAKRKVKAGEVA